MAKAVACALRDAGFHSGVIVARNEISGSAIARQYGFLWQPEIPEDATFLINVTPIGMAGGAEAEQSAFPAEQIRAAKCAFDVVASPAETLFLKLASSKGIKTITGAEVIVLQAVEQFVLYTGKRPESALVERAAAFARPSV